MRLKVKVLCRLPGVYEYLQPEVGKVYDAHYSPPKVDYHRKHHYAAVCIIDVNDKHICLRPDEYELVGG